MNHFILDINWTHRHYDKLNGIWCGLQKVLVTANTEPEARQFTQTYADRSNGQHPFDVTYIHADEKIWLDPNLTTCTEITAYQLPGVLVADYRGGGLI